MTQAAYPAVPAQISVTLFGVFHLTVAGETVPAPRARAVTWILALLILRRGKEVDRHWLATTLWPEAETPSALFNLRRNLSELRKMLGTEAYRIHSPTARTLKLDLVGITCDLIAFEALIARKDTPSLRQATSLYQGELLESCREEWILPERVVYEHAYLKALEDLAQNEIEDGNLHEAAQWLRRLTTREPLREDAQCLLMATLGRLQDFAGVERQYRDLRRRLRDELNREPAPETAVLYQSLRVQTLSPAASLPPVSPSPAASAYTNLPHPLTSLIGRTEEKRQVGTALQTARLVTLVGAGGVGKTRLALSIGEGARPHYTAGVCFADLTAAKTAADVPQAVAAAFDLRPDTGATVQDLLRRFLQPRHLLLILDNAEHIADACASLAGDLLRTCPNLTILGTSRQPLYVAGEIVLPITPLAIPDEPTLHKDAAAYAGNLMGYESVALLLDRVLSAAPAFRLTPSNAHFIAHICRSLEGLPLALELVAARFRSLAPQEIATRLESKFRLLHSGDSALPRHRTLHATLDWSYDLLSGAEQRLLRYLSVFRGGWTLEAAEAISRMEAEETVTALTSLVDKSLVVYETSSGQDRYRLLEMTRQHAAERLDVQELSELQQRHAEFFYAMAQSEDAGAALPRLPQWSLALYLERDNFRAVHVWYRQHDAEDALWLEFFLYMTCIWSPEDDREWVEKLQKQPMLPTPMGLRVTYCVGTWALWKGHPACETLLQGLLASARLCDDSIFQMYALYLLSILEEDRESPQISLRYTEEAITVAPKDMPVSFVAMQVGRVARQLARLGKADQAIDRLQTQLQEGRRNGDWRIVYPILCDLGGVLFEQSDYAKAKKAWEEGVSLAARFCPAGLPNLWRQLGWVAQAQKEYAEARHCLDQALAASRQIYSLDREGWTRWDMAELAFRQGDHEGAQTHLSACCSLFEALYEPRSITQCLVKLATYCVAWEQYHRAAILIGSADRAIEVSQFTLTAKERTAQDALGDQIRRQLGEEAWQADWEQGRQMTLVQSVAFVTTPEYQKISNSPYADRRKSLPA